MDFKKQKEYEYSHLEIITPTFLVNSTLPYLGKNYSFLVSSEVCELLLTQYFWLN
jgi:hypothetical protein